MLKHALLIAPVLMYVAGCQEAASVVAARNAEEVTDEMGPPPYEYIRILGEPVPGWIPEHRRPPAPAGPLAWSPLGPRPITDEYWSGEDDASGRVVSIAPHPADADVVYVASASGGVWKTVDGGLEWAPLTDELSSLNHGTVALDPSDPETVYAGTGEYTTGSSGDGLFKSTDGGATWERIGTKSQVGSRFTQIIVDPTDPDRIHVTGNNGYVRTDDGGATWVSRFSGWATDLAMRPDDPEVLYLARHAVGVYRSTDHGQTWTQLTSGLPADDVRRVLVEAARSDANVVYTAIINPSNGLLGLYRTDDGGDAWTRLESTPDFPRPQGWYDAFVGVDPTDADVVYCGGVFPTYAEAGVIKSTDGGAMWTDITIGALGGQLHPDQHAIAFGPDGTIWVGNDGGVWKSRDGGQSWINTNATLTVTQNYAIALNPQDPDNVMGGTQDNGTVERRKDVEDWPQILAGDGGFLAYDPEFPLRRYTTYVYLTVYRITNMTITDITGPWGSDTRNFIAPLVMDPNDPHTLLGGTNRVWRTTDAHTAATWAPISTSIVGGGGTLNAIAVATGAPDTIYTGSSSGRMFVTTDAADWRDRSAGLPAGQISDVILDPGDAARAYVGFHLTAGPRILTTDNFGVDWTDVTGDLPSGVSARAIEVDWRSAPPGLYIGTGSGVYASSDGGTTWIKDGSDLPNVNIGDLLIDRQRHTIYAGTYGRGVWTSPLPALCFADLDDSGTVDVVDLLAVLAAWGPCAGCPEDLDGSGAVDTADLLALLAAWGPCPP